ncbi:phosphate ABC transporter substrate-binding protein [Clostridium hydrogenum]|uniref:phosphate ABC transporter substrate-binding protein n=1 Tax=Clostridium hydrogenum TaxID=2855764 RepID=UPI001F352883|nr:phosphate ABC transporter substrate-binding protein [Clostridium hydrogenum]
MKSKKVKFVVAALAITVMAGLFAGCGSSTSNDKKATSDNTTKKVEKVSGSITASGSTALQPLAEDSVAGFKTKNPDANVNVQGGGSGTGLSQVAQGAVDIGDSDIYADQGGKLSADDVKALVDHKVCVIGFSVVTSSDVTVKSLTKQQIQDIFKGNITNWSKVGGPNEAINVINRPASSGTRATFFKTVMDNQSEKAGLGTTQDASGSVKTAMTSTKGAISYLALSYLTADNKKGINMVQIDGVDATTDNITAGKYSFCSYEHMYTKGEAKGVAKAFIDYMMSSDNKSQITKDGYIPISDMKVELK